MSTFVNISPGLHRIKKFRSQLSKRELAQGLSKAINKSLREGREKAIDVIASTYNIPANHLKKIRIKQANNSVLEGKIYADTSPLPLQLFKPRYTKPGEGVTFSVLKGSRGRIKYAFMVDSKHVLARGHYLPTSPYGFIRKKKAKRKSLNVKSLKKKISGKDRKSGKSGMGKQAVSKKVTVSVSGAMNAPKNKSRIENYIERQLPKNLREELQRRINKL